MSGNMQGQSLLDRLGGKVSQMMQQLQSFKEENEKLKSEFTDLQTQNDVFRKQIELLEAENASKEREIEEIVNKIESILG